MNKGAPLEMKNDPPYVFFSNKIEVLAEVLQSELFSAQDPFARRFVVVPDAKLKNYLYYYFAMRSEAKISFGLEVVTLPEALYELTRRNKKQTPFYFPTLADMSFRIEGVIVDLLSGENQKKYDTLSRYVGNISDSSRTIIRKKIIALSEQLSRFFNVLGLQPQKVIDEWLHSDDWQQHIWKTIFTSDVEWTYPERMLDKITPSQQKIYLFGFNYIPSVYLDFFTKTTVLAYILSPSEYFWEDLYSDKERVYLQKVLEGKKVRLKVRQQLDLYLRESNPLLGNWGKMGREFLKKVGSLEPYIEEYYVEPKGSCLLHFVQKDFLNLAENIAELPTIANKGSIEVHATTSVLREVEVLFEKIQQLIDSQEEKGLLQPKDILVLCPNIESYTPYIHQVFSQAEFPYRMLDVKQRQSADILKAFEILLKLSEDRYDKNSVLELLSCKPFIEKLGVKQEEITKITTWIEGVGIKWGLDRENKEDIVKNSLGYSHRIEQAGSWSFGFERLLTGLIFAKSEEDYLGECVYAWPKYGIDWNQSEVLGKVIFTLSLLFQDLRELENKDKLFTEWVDIFSEISTKYFSAEHKNEFNFECRRILSGCQEMSGSYSLESFRRIVSALQKKKTESFYSGQINAVTFSALRSGSVLPSEVIYLLGMEEESYPRTDISLSMCDMTKIKNKSYYPSRQEEDRFLFLECLLCAGSKLIMSYSRISAADHQPQGPSVLIEELLSYIEQRYSLMQKESCLISHPPFAFHSSYFSEDSRFFPLSISSQKAALTYYSGEKNAQPPLFPTLYGRSLIVSEQKTAETIKIKDLLRFAKHPLKFYMQTVLGIYPTSLFQEDNQEFILPFYASAQMKKELLKNSYQSIFSIARLKGELPVGVFEDVAVHKVQKEMDDISAHLKLWGINKNQVRNVHFQSACQREFEVDKNSILPGLSITTPKGRKFLLEGILSDVSDRGLLYYGEDSFKGLVSIWPIYLVFLVAQKKYQRWDESLFALKKAAHCELFVEEEQLLLGQYLDYYYEAKFSPSLLIPELAESILLNDYQAFCKHLQEKIHDDTFVDDYVRWLFFRDSMPTKEGFEELRRIIPESLFAPLLERKGTS
ncbi:MAG: exonuclease V subunit gamma [Chlamydiae bacterium]|nr:exonuclease V subunit gamma [Chlamydiota bacterium]